MDYSPPAGVVVALPPLLLRAHNYPRHLFVCHRLAALFGTRQSTVGGTGGGVALHGSRIGAGTPSAAPRGGGGSSRGCHSQGQETERRVVRKL